MKAINADRIKSALDKIQAACDRSCGSDFDLIEQFAMLGLKSAIGCDREIDHQKAGLEVAYRNAPRDPDRLKALMRDCFRRATRFADKREKVYAIQSKYKVSGLMPKSDVFGGQEICYPWESDQLRLITEDLVELRTWKPKVCEVWMDYCILSGLTFFRRFRDDGEEGEWREIETSVILALLPLYDWCNIWENTHYFSPSLMRKQGFDSPRSQPIRPDDEKHQEVHMILGRGIDTSSCESDHIWFCACNSFPMN